MSGSKQWSPEGGGTLIEKNTNQKRQKPAPKPTTADKSASKAKETE